MARTRQRSQASLQKGMALLAFTVALAIVAFTIVMGYSVSSAKQQVKRLESNQEAYLNDVRSKLVAAYAANALTIDADGSWQGLQTGEALLTLADVAPRWGIQAAISPPIAREGVKFRVMAAWLPLDASVPDEPIMNADGTFNPCPGGTPDCVNRRAYVMISDGFAIQRANAKKALDQLDQLAKNAQGYFKSKTMLDPEHNISVNYFRPPYGGCSPIAEQMPCLETPQALFGINPATQLQNSSQLITELLGLANAPVLNPWGLPVMACNGIACLNGLPDPAVRWDPLVQGPPYSMVFSTSTPWGSVLKMYAIQQL